MKKKVGKMNMKSQKYETIHGNFSKLIQIHKIKWQKQHAQTCQYD